MIERVAEAIHDKRPSRVVKWDSCVELYKNEIREQATAAIQAMREPTEEMIEAPDTEDYIEAYKNMIDAALKE